MSPCAASLPALATLFLLLPAAAGAATVTGTGGSDTLRGTAQTDTIRATGR